MVSFHALRWDSEVRSELVGDPLTQGGAGGDLEFVLAETEQEAGLAHGGVPGQDDPVGLLRCHVAQVGAAVRVLLLESRDTSCCP